MVQVFSKGFTLVEISVTVAITGILAATGISMYTDGVQHQAELSSLRRIAKSYQDGAAFFYLAEGRLPADASEFVTINGRPATVNETFNMIPSGLNCSAPQDYAVFCTGFNTMDMIGVSFSTEGDLEGQGGEDHVFYFYIKNGVKYCHYLGRTDGC